MSGLLITATDTDAGKTLLTCALIAYWQRYCHAYRLGVLKPLQSGPGDRELYQRLFDLEQPNALLNPIYYDAPLAPPIAARLAQQSIDLTPAWQAYCTLSRERDWVLVEGVGGLGSPVTEELTMADLAADWRLPVVLVVAVRLGAIAQAVANVALARQQGLQLRGIVLNYRQPVPSDAADQLAPASLIASLTQVPVLGTLPYLDDADDLGSLAQAAKGLSLERIMPQPFWVKDLTPTRSTSTRS
ncbi:MAG: dethiobiotin synthase [Cyanobacteria bacterium J06554_6]